MSRISKVFFPKSLLIWIFCSLLFFRYCIAEISSVPNHDIWITNGPVNAIIEDQGRLYLGGEFTYIGPNTGHGAVYDTQTGEVLNDYPRLGGRIQACVSDGSGGWYIGERTTPLGDAAKTRIVHIQPDGSLESNWAPEVNGIVYALAVSGTTVYVGGYFNQVEGVERHNLAALETTTGTLTPWNPDANDIVRALLVVDDSVYVGGTFTMIGGHAHTWIAELDRATGLATDWNPDIISEEYGDSGILCFAYSDSTLYAGGFFSNVDGRVRSNLVAFNASTGVVTDWAPNPNSDVLSLDVDGSTVYAGGYFGEIGGINQNGIAAIDATSGIVSNWNTSFDCTDFYLCQNYVSTVKVVDSILYIGGGFSIINGSSRKNIAAFDTLTGQLLERPIHATHEVRAMAVSGSQLYVGGNFISINGQLSDMLAVIDSQTGQAIEWGPTGYTVENEKYGPFPPVPHEIRDFAISDSVLYAIGDFEKIAGQSTDSSLVAFDLNSGEILNWAPQSNMSGNTLAVSGSTIYVGGTGVIALDISDNYNILWGIDADGPVNTFAKSGSILYVGGEFTSFGGESRANLASIDVITGNVMSWNPGASGKAGDFSFPFPLVDPYVRDILVSDGIIYAGGGFSTCGGQPRKNVAALDAITGMATSWNPEFTRTTNSISLYNSMIFAGGLNLQNPFSSNAGATVALHQTSGHVLSWSPQLNFPVNALYFTGNKVYVGGEFTTCNNLSQPYFAQFNISYDSPLCLTEFGEAWGSLNDGAALAEPTKWNQLGFKHDASTGWQTLPGDFDGDGLMELLTVTEYGEAWLTFNSGNETFDSTFNSAPGYLFDENNGWAAVAGDFDGDALTDLAQVTEYGDIWVGFNSGGAIPSPSIASNAGAIYDPDNGFWMGAGDMNGDGLDDIVELHPDGQVVVHAANGSGFDAPAGWGAFGFQYNRGDASNPGYGIVIGDFNDDGRDDLLTLTPYTDAWVAPSNGTGFDAPTRWGWLGFKYAPRLNNGWDIFVGDVNGDGIDDLVQLSEYGEVWFAASTGTELISPPAKLGAVGFRSNPEGTWRSYVGRLK